MMTRVKNVDFQVYDTSGFYSDPDVPVDVNRGLKHVRDSWIAERKDTKQLEEHSSDYSKKIKKEPDDFSSFKGKFLPRVAASKRQKRFTNALCEKRNNYT